MAHPIIFLKDIGRGVVEATDLGAQIHTRVEDGYYTGQDLTDANDLLDNLETNAETAKDALDASITAMKTFLG